ncbi:ABC transporter permease [Roseomonas stagni]|uniref:ABC transporter permease n=1 Tax=Falsiroseomonas algicola TaxID=2716930 RepID=A0A6M1LTT5_9PROT|nr:ABC transporter permease [Falsiroseomonas algicola]NGM23895.1 ABC transporter permease [Falsiroseomonas algicola]
MPSDLSVPAPALPSLRLPGLDALALALRQVGPAALLFLSILLVWEGVTRAGLVSPLILPAPSDVAATFVSSAPRLFLHLGWTSMAALGGFVLGNTLGFALAVVFVHLRLARLTALPLAMMAQAVPIVAVAPALLLWLGNGVEPKLFIASFLVFFPMLVNAMRGLASADDQVAELLHTLSADWKQRLLIVRLPAALPFVFNALRLSACGCFVASVVAEWVASTTGLGYVIVFASSQYRMTEVWCAVLLCTAASLCVYGLVCLAERLAMPWRRERPGPA